MESLKRFESLKQYKKSMTEKFHHAETELLKEQSKLLLLEKYKTIIQTVREEFVSRMSSRLESIQRMALKDIIKDIDYDFKMSVCSRYNKTNLDIHIRKIEEGKTKYRRLENSGDGIKSILRLSSAISALIFSNNRRVLAIDEEATGISKDHNGNNYYAQTMQWLNKVSEKFNIQIIFITHEEQTRDYANKSFNVSSGIVKEVV